MAERTSAAAPSKRAPRGSSRRSAALRHREIALPRIFFRNSINNGLLLIEQPDLHDDIKEGDTITVKMNEHVDYNGKTYPIAALPENLMDIIQAGGLVKAMRKRNGLD